MERRVVLWPVGAVALLLCQPSKGRLLPRITACFYGSQMRKFRSHQRIFPDGNWSDCLFSWALCDDVNAILKSDWSLAVSRFPWKSHNFILDLMSFTLGPEWEIESTSRQLLGQYESTWRDDSCRRVIQLQPNSVPALGFHYPLFARNRLRWPSKTQSGISTVVLLVGLRTSQVSCNYLYARRGIILRQASADVQTE